MIRYALACEAGHAFESWFSSSEDFDAQAARGLVACPYCDTTKVSKQIMAPSVARKDRAPSREQPDQEPSHGPSHGPANGPVPGGMPLPAAPCASDCGPVALVSEAEHQVREAIRHLRAFVSANAEDVGRSFSEEARRIHEGDAPERFIVGEATSEEVAELMEDGIPIQPLPILPEDRN